MIGSSTETGVAGLSAIEALAPWSRMVDTMRWACVAAS